jgi:hypothetical protein
LVPSSSPLEMLLGAGVGGTAASSSAPLDSKAVIQIYDFLFNTSHASSVLHPSASSSSSSRTSCRLLEARQLKLPVQKNDAAIWLRYEYCEAMRRVCDEAIGGQAQQQDETGPASAPVVPSAKQTLFILRSLNDPTPSFKSFSHLGALLEQVRLTRARTDPSLVAGVEALGAGAREIFSYLSAATGKGASAGGAGLGVGGYSSDAGGALPGMAGAVDSGGSSDDGGQDKLVLTGDLLASLVEAGGGSIGSGGEGGAGSSSSDMAASSSSSVAASSSPPPALTILSHMSLMGDFELYSKGHGDELVAAVREQKAKADSVRRALADNIKASLLQHDGATSSMRASRAGPRLLSVVPEKVSQSLVALGLALEDLLPRLNEVRPLLQTGLPNALRQVHALHTRMEGEALAELKKRVQAYTTSANSSGEDEKDNAAAPEGTDVTAADPDPTAAAAALVSVLSPLLSTLQSLFLSLPSLSKRFSDFYLLLQPLHKSLHHSYTHFYPSLFYLSHFVSPTPHPFFASLLPSLTDAVQALATLRIDTAQVLAVQHSLRFVIGEKLVPLLQDTLQQLDAVARKAQANAQARAAASASGISVVDPVQSVSSVVSSTAAYLHSLLPFLSSLSATNEHHLAFLTDLVPFFEAQLKPLLPTILPLLVPGTAGEAVVESNSSS